MMTTNYKRLPEIARVAFAAGANYRVNVYQPVKTDAFTLFYVEFWEGFRRLLGVTRLVSTTEPILDAMLGQPFKTGSGCGRQTVRVTPKGAIIPCVYWGTSDMRFEDLRSQGADGVLASPQFARRLRWSAASWRAGSSTVIRIARPFAASALRWTGRRPCARSC